jgi:hypothetical protein
VRRQWRPCIIIHHHHHHKMASPASSSDLSALEAEVLQLRAEKQVALELQVEQDLELQMQKGLIATLEAHVEHQDLELEDVVEKQDDAWQLGWRDGWSKGLKEGRRASKAEEKGKGKGAEGKNGKGKGAEGHKGKDKGKGAEGNKGQGKDAEVIDVARVIAQSAHGWAKIVEEASGTTPRCPLCTHVHRAKSIDGLKRHVWVVHRAKMERLQDEMDEEEEEEEEEQG